MGGVPRAARCGPSGRPPLPRAIVISPLWALGFGWLRSRMGMQLRYARKNWFSSLSACVREQLVRSEVLNVYVAKHNIVLSTVASVLISSRQRNQRRVRNAVLSKRKTVRCADVHGGSVGAARRWPYFKPQRFPDMRDAEPRFARIYASWRGCLFSFPIHSALRLV
jgi:hypothetical protein